MQQAVGQDFVLAFVALTRKSLRVLEACKFLTVLLFYPDLETAVKEIGQQSKPLTTDDWTKAMNRLLAGAATRRAENWKGK
jgi:hypothetical protein